MLQLRGSARRAFHQVNNSDVLRRALLRRACPNRGNYQQGQWVMIWRSGQHLTKGLWHGPQRVIIQDGNHTIWTTQGGKLYRSAPEHVRLALPAEGQDDSCELPHDLTAIHQQIQRLSQTEFTHNDPHQINPQSMDSLEFPLTEIPQLLSHHNLKLKLQRCPE